MGSPSAPGDDPGSDWPGRRLGLPPSGTRSVARLGRRIVALGIDWAIALVLSIAFFPTGPWQSDPFITLGVFAASQIIFLLLINGGVGHIVMRLRVVPIVPGRLGIWRPVVRTLLLCLALPAAIWDRDQRGLHDLLAGTVLVRV